MFSLLNIFFEEPIEKESPERRDCERLQEICESLRVGLCTGHQALVSPRWRSFFRQLARTKLMNCHVDMSPGWIFAELNCRRAELSPGWIVAKLNCHRAKMSPGRIVAGLNWYRVELTRSWIVTGLNCRRQAWDLTGRDKRTKVVCDGTHLIRYVLTCCCRICLVNNIIFVFPCHVEQRGWNGTS